MRLSIKPSYGSFALAVERFRLEFLARFRVSLISLTIVSAGTVGMTQLVGAQILVDQALADQTLVDQVLVDQVLAETGKPIKLVVLGDSLTAGFGLPAAQAFPVQLQKALKENGVEVDAINAGVSGDTSSGGRDRLDWSIPDGTAAVIIELGANDALRGVDPTITRSALTDIIKALQAKGIAVMLCGMYAPRNFGPDYVAKFDPIYPDLAKTYGVPLYPFFLEGIAGQTALTQADGLHPTGEGVAMIVKRILPAVQNFLKQLPASSSARNG